MDVHMGFLAGVFNLFWSVARRALAGRYGRGSNLRTDRSKARTSYRCSDCACHHQWTPGNLYSHLPKMVLLVVLSYPGILLL